jgi:hypothetical protein
MRKPIWNDRAFKKWVRDGAKARGLPLHEVLSAAGVSRFYLNEDAENRGTNVVLNLADALQLSPAALFGLSAKTRSLKDSVRLWEARFSNADLPRTERMTMAARVIMVQMATLASIAADQVGSDPATLMELVLREVSRSNNGTAADPAADENAA